MLSKEALNEFRQIWKEKFNKELSIQEANQRAFELLSVFKLIYHPMPKKYSEKGWK